LVFSKIINKIKKREDYIETLRKRGLKCGENLNIYNTEIDYGFCFLVEIGDNVTITHSTILAHDASTKMYLGKSRVGKVKIGNRVFIGWGSTILPNVEIGDDVIVAAGSVVNRSIPNNCVVAGVPARIIGKTTDFIEKNKTLINKCPVFHTNWRNKTIEEMEEMKIKLEGTIGYDE
jgi:maltose O-acetyltransferase